MTFNQASKYVLSVPKTIYFNFRTLPIKQAVKIPIFVSYATKLLSLRKGCIKLDNTIKYKTFSVVIGFNGTGVVPPQKSMISLKKGSIFFEGITHIAEGCVIDIDGGDLKLGKNFSANRNFWISCNKSITIGDEAMLGWNVKCFDATGHSVFINGHEKDAYKPIIIGEHVWIGSESHILKGTVIPDNSIVAYGSVVTRRFDAPNSIYGGIPSNLIQSGISWQK